MKNWFLKVNSDHFSLSPKAAKHLRRIQPLRGRERREPGDLQGQLRRDGGQLPMRQREVHLRPLEMRRVRLLVVRGRQRRDRVGLRSGGQFNLVS